MGVRFDSAAPYDVEEHDTSFARPDGQELLARIYRPSEDAAQPLTAIVDVHGGAWTRLDRTVGAPHARALAACGLVVVSIDFRQGPAHQHPAAARDVSAGVRYVRAHARRLGADPDSIGVLGSSSGGHLALLVAVRPHAAEHAGTPVVLPGGTLDDGRGDDSVRFAIALYPVADPLARYRYVLTREHEAPPPSGFNAKGLIASHRGYFPDEAAMSAASVTRIVASGEARALPPVWLAQPERDDNVPAEITDAFVDAYGRAGGSIERVRFPGARHSFIQQPGADTDKCIALMREFVGRQRRPISSR